MFLLLLSSSTPSTIYLYLPFLHLPSYQCLLFPSFPFCIFLVSFLHSYLALPTSIFFIILPSLVQLHFFPCNLLPFHSVLPMYVPSFQPLFLLFLHIFTFPFIRLFFPSFPVHFFFFSYFNPYISPFSHIFLHLSFPST